MIKYEASFFCFETNKKCAASFVLNQDAPVLPQLKIAKAKAIEVFRKNGHAVAESDIKEAVESLLLFINTKHAAQEKGDTRSHQLASFGPGAKRK